ncbi:MAG: hypothetical protein K1X71_17940 [Pirellulales bacterium]|nr:hypothetical protein [Pirellulales bacterium]
MPTKRWMTPLLLSLFLSPVFVWSQESADAEVEEAEVVTADSGDVATVEEEASHQFRALAIEPREADGQSYFIRQSSDAFVDPDQRQSLEAKYYFVLGTPPPNSTKQEEVAFYFETPASVEIVRSFGELPSAATKQQPAKAMGGWLDANAKPQPSRLAIYLAGAIQRDGKASSGGKLLVCRAAPGEVEVATIESVLAHRELPADEQVIDVAMWEIPEAWKSKATLLSRLVALLKRVDGRYCVDFYSQSLNAEADCRLWLTTEDHPLGRPISLAFGPLAIRKESQQIVETDIAELTYFGAEGQRTRIGVDFPMCRPALMEQMQRLTAARRPQANRAAKGPDLSKLLGADLLEEFSRRIVNGTYK